MWVWSLGREDLLEKDMPTHSSIPAWKVPGTEEPGGLQSMGLPRITHTTERTHLFKPLISKYSHILRYWGLGLQQMKMAGKTQ